MFPSQAPKFRRRMAPLALFAGVLVGVLLPGVNAKRIEAERVGEAALWAQQLGARLGKEARLRPRLWAYDSDVLRQLTDEILQPPLMAGIRIDVPKHNSIFSAGPPERSTDVRGWSVIRAGRTIVGRIEVRLDGTVMGEELRRNWWVAGILGAALCAALYFLPVGTVRRGDDHNQELWNALSDANSTLETRVQKRTEQLRKLSARLVRIQEEERARLSRNLHDELGQTLTGLRLRLTALSLLVEGNDQAMDQLVEALKSIDSGVDQVRGLAHNLRPPALDALGLGDAIQSLASEWGHLSQLEVETNIEAVDTDPQRAEVIFRVLQEALTNITRHAKAGRVYVDLSCADGWLCLKVCDDGHGFQDDAHSGLGLMGIQERLSQYGGQLILSASSDLGGAELKALLPTDVESK